VPRPYWDLTARDVLTTEWIDGIRLNDLALIEAPATTGSRSDAR
jgi:ubiquinone biosynthesis protein